MNKKSKKLNKFELYSDNQNKYIKELEKLSDHQLKARLIYELHYLNANYRDANWLNIEKMYKYLYWRDNLKDENDELSFEDYLNKV